MVMILKNDLVKSANPQLQKLAVKKKSHTADDLPRRSGTKAGTPITDVAN